MVCQLNISCVHIMFYMYFYLYCLKYFITHGYLPPDFMKTAQVSIIKNKTGDTNDKNNYRPIALMTAVSKIFEICILELL